MSDVFGAILLVLLSVLNVIGIFKPKLFLKLSDIFRLKGDREYTEWAVSWTVFGCMFSATAFGTMAYFYIDYLINR